MCVEVASAIQTRSMARDSPENHIRHARGPSQQNLSILLEGAETSRDPKGKMYLEDLVPDVAEVRIEYQNTRKQIQHMTRWASQQICVMV